MDTPSIVAIIAFAVSNIAITWCILLQKRLNELEAQPQPKEFKKKR